MAANLEANRRPRPRRSLAIHRRIRRLRASTLPAYKDPAAPFGRQPMTGEPYSDKSKIVAGLLQLLGLFGIVGIGRMYLG